MFFTSVAFFRVVLLESKMSLFGGLCVYAFKGKCGYIHRMAKVNMPLPFVGALQDDNAVDRMCLYFSSGFWRFSCPRDVDVVGHDGCKLCVWGVKRRVCLLCLGKSWWCSKVEIVVGCVFSVAASKRI